MTKMSELPSFRRASALAAVGASLVVMAWLLPVHWSAVAPIVAQRAGQGTPTLTDLGLALVAEEKPGPAGLILAACELLRDPQRQKLAAALIDLKSRRADLTAWGGADPQLEGVLERTGAGRLPVMEAFLPEPAREGLRERLGASVLPGTQAILNTRHLGDTVQFVPATRPGGQPFDATILLMAFLCEGEYLSPSLAQEIKTLARQAVEGDASAGWESACMDVLALAKRLDWTQLTELVKWAPGLKTLSGLAHSAKTTPERFPIVYAAVLLAQSAEGVADYLRRHPGAGADDLAAALAHGQGAVRHLIERNLPLSPPGPDAARFAASLVWKAPAAMLALKMICFLLAVGCFHAVWSRLASIERVEGLSVLSPMFRLRRGGVAVTLAILLMASSEPLIFHSTGMAGDHPRWTLPVLSNSPVPAGPSPNTETLSLIMNLDMSTILSVALFAALQIVVYATCLLKIHEIHRQPATPQLKLKLMENEENLFDAGLYVGIAGTAAALVLQVLQIIEANLLAAYSSNLFGILCVALVKIRHVRAFKRKLILQSQREPAESSPQAQPEPAV